MSQIRALTMYVNVFGDPHEQKQLSFLWFGKQKILYEFYAGQRSLRCRHKNISWFPCNLSPEDVFQYFSTIPSSLLWNYISHTDDILFQKYQDYGVFQWNYMDTFAQDTPTRLGLAGAILQTATDASITIQRMWRRKKIGNNNKPTL